MITLMERLGVNVISVVIGALFFLIAIAWVEALRSLAEYVYFHEDGIKDYHTLQKKILAAIFVTALSGVLIIVIYCIYRNSPTSRKVETPKPEETHYHESHIDPGQNSFPGVSGATPDFISGDISGDFDDA